MLNKVISSVLSKNKNDFTKLADNFDKDFEKYWGAEGELNAMVVPGTAKHTKGVMAALLDFMKCEPQNFAQSEYIKSLFEKLKNPDKNAHDVYEEINKICLNEFKHFLSGLVFNKNKKDQNFWREVINDFILFHDYKKTEGKEAFHEELSANYYTDTFLSKNIAKKLTPDEKFKKELVVFLIKNHIVVGIPVIGELSSKAFKQTINELNVLCEKYKKDVPGIDGTVFKKKVIRLLIVQGLADSAQGKLCFPSEVSFYYYLWSKIPQLLKGKRVFLPTQESLAFWAAKNGDKSFLPSTGEQTEFIYRVAKLTQGQVEVKDLNFTFEEFDNAFKEVRYFKRIIYEKTKNLKLSEYIKGTWLINFNQVIKGIEQFSNRSINKIIIREMVGDYYYDSSTSALYVSYIVDLGDKLWDLVTEVTKDIYTEWSFDYSHIKANFGDYDGVRLVRDSESPYYREFWSEQEFKSAIAKIIGFLDITSTKIPTILDALRDYFLIVRAKRWIDEVILMDLFRAVARYKLSGSFFDPQLFLDIIEIEKKYLELLPRTEEIMVFIKVECIDYQKEYVEVDIRNQRVSRSVFSYYSKFCDSPEELKEFVGSIKNFVANNPSPNISLARLCAVFAKIKMPQPLKCMVVDCDGTLWRGTADEDELAEIKVDERFKAFQQQLLHLKEQGVLLAIVSKNDEERLLNVLENHPDMILRKADFVRIKANWNDKADNIKVIAEEITIGLDTFMFLDDSPYERQQIMTALPAVVVPDLALHLAERVQYLANLAGLLEKQNQTFESSNRSELYRHKEARDNLLKISMSNGKDEETALKELEITAHIREAAPADFNRIAELSVRTNRMRLNDKVLTPVELNKIYTSHEHRIFTLEVADKVGSDGLVGALIAKKVSDTENVWQLSAFYMSCRVAGKEADTAFLSYIINKLSKLGKNNYGKGNLWIADYQDTGKNSNIRVFLEKYGFKQTLPDQIFKFSGKT